MTKFKNCVTFIVSVNGRPIVYGYASLPDEVSCGMSICRQAVPVAVIYYSPEVAQSVPEGTEVRAEVVEVINLGEVQV